MLRALISLAALLCASVATAGPLLSQKPRTTSKTPVIFAMDANYDDILALLYVVKHPQLELKAVAVAATGMATPHGGPVNMKRLLEYLGLGNIPVSYGQNEAHMPVVTMPLQWRVELDLFFDQLVQEGVLPAKVGLPSPLTSAELIVDTIRASTVPVVILSTAPVTDIASALKLDRGIVDKISSVYLMGSAYKSKNNVYDWQMNFNGVYGACSEVPSGNNDAEDKSLNVTKLTGRKAPDGGDMWSHRAGCRGVDMEARGNTEWNLFMDALAWHRVTQALHKSSVNVYIYPVNATAEMTVNTAQVKPYTDKLPKETKVLVEKVFAQFLNAGEAKWWDAQTAVSMAEIVSGWDATGKGVCASWHRKQSAELSLAWSSSGSARLGYGSVTADPNGLAPRADYCVLGNEDWMFKTFFDVLTTGVPPTSVF